MTWNTKLTNIYNLASLHSWIDQIDEMIINFIADIGDGYNEVVEYILEDIKSEHFSIEHDIISLVLLNYFEYSPLKIIDLANKKLYGKISKNDINFFRKHLFSGNLPLSADLSYDITNRSFLSPKKAIKKAMEIDSVISKENPQLTVLYMCFILSRMDMNEENRAMVAFLLLRIDIDLPPGLQQRVHKYLWEYKDIIQELLEEEKDGPVIFENIQSLQEKISSVKIIEKKEDTNSDANILDIQSAGIKANIKKSNPEIKVRKKQIVNVPEVEVESTSVPDKVIYKPVPSNTNNTVSNNKAVERVPENNIITIEKNIAELSDNKEKIQSVVHSEKTPANIPADKESKIKKNSDKKYILEDPKGQTVFLKKESDKTQIVPNVKKSESNEIIEKGNDKKTIPLENKSWNITLKRNKDILESILNGIFKNSKKNIKISKVSNNTSVKSETRENIIDKKNIIKHKKLSIGVVFFIILGFFIYLAVGKYTNYSTGEKKSVNKSVSVTKAISNSGNLTSQSKLSIPEKSEALENKKLSIPADFPFNITIDGNNLSWKVSQGDSITGLYYALKNYKTRLIGTALEKISNMDWKTFFNDFKKNNPKRTSYHLIYPYETFILSLD